MPLAAIGTLVWNSFSALSVSGPNPPSTVSSLAGRLAAVVEALLQLLDRHPLGAGLQLGVGAEGRVERDLGVARPDDDGVVVADLDRRGGELELRVGDSGDLAVLRHAGDARRHQALLELLGGRGGRGVEPPGDRQPRSGADGVELLLDDAHVVRGAVALLEALHGQRLHVSGHRPVADLLLQLGQPVRRGARVLAVGPLPRLLGMAAPRPLGHGSTVVLGGRPGRERGADRARKGSRVRLLGWGMMAMRPAAV